MLKRVVKIVKTIARFVKGFAVRLFSVFLLYVCDRYHFERFRKICDRMMSINLQVMNVSDRSK